MALEFELMDEDDFAAVRKMAATWRDDPERARAMTPAYTGVGDAVLAQPDLVCGVAEPAGLPLVGASDDGARHPLEP